MLSQLKLSPLQRLLFFFFGRVSTTLLDVLTQLITVSAQYVQASPFRPAPTKQKTTRSDIKPHNKATFSNGDEVALTCGRHSSLPSPNLLLSLRYFIHLKKKLYLSKKKKKIHRTKAGDSHSNSVSHPSILEQLSVITRALKLIKVVASKSQFVIGIASHGHSY